MYILLTATSTRFPHLGCGVSSWVTASWGTGEAVFRELFFREVDLSGDLRCVEPESELSMERTDPALFEWRDGGSFSCEGSWVSSGGSEETLGGSAWRTLLRK